MNARIKRHAKSVSHLDPLHLHTQPNPHSLQSHADQASPNLNPLWMITVALAALVVLFFTFG